MDDPTVSPPQSQPFDRGRSPSALIAPRPEQFIHPSRQHIHDRNAATSTENHHESARTGVIKDAIRQIEERAKRNAPIAQYDRSVIRGLRDGTLQASPGGGSGLTEATKALAILANPDTRIHNHQRDLDQGPSAHENPAIHVPPEDGQPGAIPAHLGVLAPHTEISVHVHHQNVGNGNTAPSTDDDNEGKDEAEATTVDSGESTDVAEFIRGAIASVSDAQVQESRKLLEVLGRSLLQELQGRKPRGTR